MVEQLTAWLEKQREELLNMSRANRALYFKHTKTASLEVERPGPDVLLERLNRGSSNVAVWDFFLPVEQVEGEPRSQRAPKQTELVIADKDRTQLLRALHLLERKSKQEYVDKGIWVLNLGLGMLRWRESDDTGEVAISPLLMVPVTISRESLGDSFRMRRTSDDPVLNPALAVKLQADFSISLPTLEDFEERGFAAIMTDVEERIGSRKGWSVLPRAVLSTFTFHKEAMYRDLLDNENELIESPLVQVLALGPDAPSAGSYDFPTVPDEQLDRKVTPEELVSVLDTDASQRRCVIAAREGRSFVMDGPPGSGKSQTITNVIAELLHIGKTVLFVSEKAAALDVVHNRLSKANLDGFALKLHSHDANRKAVAAELGRALAYRPAASDSFTASNRAGLIRRREDLSSYAQAMNEIRRPLGRSLFQVLGSIAQLSETLQAPVPAGFGSSLQPDEYTRLVDVAAKLGRVWGPVLRGGDFLWRDLADATMSASRHSEVVRMLDDARQALGAVQSLVLVIDDEFGLGWTSGPDDARRQLGLLTVLDDRRDVPVDWLCAADLAPVGRRLEELAKASAEHTVMIDGLKAAVGEDARRLEPSQLASLENAVSWLERHRLSWKLTEEFGVKALRAAAGFLRDGVAVLGEIGADAVQVADALGLPTENLSLARSLELAELGALAGVPNAPESRWLDPAAQTALDQAAQTLGQLLEEFRGRRDELRGVFRDEVLALDLAGLNARFTKVYRGVRKLSRAYREDKRILAACTITGRIDDEVRARLADAVAWKDLEDKLTTAEARHAQALGEHYYQRADADFTRIAEAIEVAHQAVRLAGEKIGHQFVRQIARDGTPDPALPATAGRLGHASETWLNEAKQLTGVKARDLRRTPLNHLIDWAGEAADRLDAVAGGVHHVATVADKPVSVPFAVVALRDAAAAQEMRRQIENRFAENAQLFGDGFRGLETDWASLRSSVAWVEDLRAQLGRRVQRSVAEAVLGSSLTSADLRDRMARWDKAAALIVDGFIGRQAAEVSESLDDDFEFAEEFLNELAHTIGDIGEWAAHQAAKAELAEAGLEPVVSFCAEQRVGADQVKPIVERALLEAWADDVLKLDVERLGALRAADRDALVEEFAELDRAHIANASARVVNACAARRPASNAGAAAIIQRESQKQRRHMPIRELLSKAGPVAHLLKPCFMMSPLAVSQYLPSTIRFDAVIFDEASQVRPSDAINCVYRGAQLIVAGDQKQLPPSSFFAKLDVIEDNSYDDEQVDDFESLLDLCKAAGALKSLSLNWHYRSQHESLITYSNYRFYEGKLLTFPGATREAADVGIEVFKVDGIYRRGGARDNPIEAAKVIERVLHHRRHHPELTLGVVTFSGTQQDAIEHELEAQSARYPELVQLSSDDRLRGFFVKNLENVQVDERDIIIFSIGYGPDENGKVTLNLGPLTNSKDGWRRLNVAITRAQRRVEIVTSVTPGQLSGNAKWDGLRHLRGYLDFAQRGKAALVMSLDESEGDVESPFEEEVLRVIRSWGYDAVPQVGVAGYRIDIGIRDEENQGTYALGVECDGAMYHSAKVARDRDRLRQQVLEGLGWRIHRIWGTAWYRDRARQEERLRDAIEAAISRERPEFRKVAAEPVTPDIRHHEVDFDLPPAWTESYRTADLEPVRTPFEMHVPEARGHLRRLIEAVVEVEGPVHHERVLRTIRQAWGVGRSGPRIKEAFKRVLGEVARGRWEIDGGGFVKVRSTTLPAVRVPTDKPETQRDVKELPAEELRLAVNRIVADARSISVGELHTSVARLFGWQRTGPDIRAALEGAVEHVIRSGAVRQMGEQLESQER
jgi:very-short-patch-repair endonuclease